jgi:electron transport complex protein RnfB
MKRAALARVDEARCIGCARCIDACPVDAIVGAPGLMHTVVASWCIGCRLCVPPCPVDCIDMVAARNLSLDEKRAAGERGRNRLRRLSSQAIQSHGAEERRAILAELLGRK